MAIISKKKIPFPISEELRTFLYKYNRHKDIAIHYQDLTRFNDAMPLYDLNGEDTLWKTVLYPPSDMGHIYESLKQIYALLKAAGDLSVMEHLYFH